ncbi:Por secretion system C-terminal sorting domain-containing protein [Reichenbachiella faecimaris]|uniref:Por secretion system C-terminal sorting domain-containing protein n=1 Tax=Reichenbachiella faecimaris TaxID=692418 RepID=A0A1W2GDP2_REIFA|nr:putative Ig domain-containing protein [Reichenbachiella faecimaris]SMD34644.1 Por secretion system C-terminal sorting domain-containing protein [Reichenbachiella faecimaris]
MDYQNYLYLEYRRTLRKFRKLQLRFEKRISKDTFQDLTARRRYKILTQLRKLKQKIEQLTSRLKLAAAGGSLAFSMAMAPDINAQQAAAASGVPGTPKYLTADKTLVNDETTGAQEAPEVSYNNDGNFVVIWEDNGENIHGKAYGGDVDQSLSFDVVEGININDAAVALNDEDQFIVVWAEDDGGRPPAEYEIKYMRYEVEDGAITNDGPFTVASGSNGMGEVDVAMDASGNFVIVWEENGAYNEEIKAKYYTSDNSSKEELAVSQTPTRSHTDPSIDLDEEGNFIVVWKSIDGSGTTYSVINGRKYHEGTPDDDTFIVHSATDYDDGTKVKTPDVDLNGDGGFVVAWEYEDYIGSSEYIRAQIFDGEGSPQVDGDISVAGFQNTTNPKIAADKDGGFAVVYNTYEYSGNQSIKGSRYNRFGDEIESWDFYNEGDEGNVASHPAIGMNDRGDFVVAWEDNLNSLADGECPEGADCDGSAIYFKRYQDGENQPYNILDSEIINTYTSGVQNNPAIAKDGDGNYIVVWEGSWDPAYESGYGIMGQRFYADGTKNGEEFHINTTTTNSQRDPDVASNANGQFIVTWKGDAGNSSFGIFAQMYNAAGEANGTEIRVDDETTGFFNHYNPSVAMDNDGNAIIIYVEDYSQDILKARRINTDATTDGDEFKIDAYTFSGERNYPDIALNNDGSFVATFGRESGGEEHTYYRRFDAEDSPLDANDVRISGGTSSATRRQSIVMDDDGNFAIVYTEYYEDNSAVLVSKFTKEGSIIFEDVELTNNAPNDFVPSVDTNNLGEVAITWEERWDGDITPVSILDIEGEIFVEYYYPFGSSSIGSFPTLIINENSEVTITRAKSGEIHGASFAKPLEVNIDAGNEFIVNSTTTNTQEKPDVAQNENGDFVVVWRDYSNSSYPAVRAQRYNKEGIRQGSEIKVNSSTMSSLDDPEVALNDNGNFMVVWTEYSVVGGESDDILGRVFDWDGTELMTESIINEETNYNQYNPDIAIRSGGDFQVIWSERYSSDDSWNRVYSQLYSANGEPDESGNQTLFELEEIENVNLKASIAINDSGEMAIPYIYDYDGVTNGFYVFNEKLEIIADNVSFSESSYVDSNKPPVTTDEDGDFILTWSEYILGDEVYNLMARTYSAENGFDSDPVIIGELESEVSPNIALVDDGDLIISYTQYEVEADLYSAYIRRISSELNPIGPEIKINEISASGSTNNAIASSPDGSYTVVWQSQYADNSSDAIMARQFVSHKPIVENYGLTLDEGAATAFSSEHLILENPAGNDQEAYVTFTSLPDHGTLTIEGGAVVEGDELGIENIGLLTYTHDGSETTADTFSFKVTNENFETDLLDFDITVTPVNDLPELAANHGLQLDEGDSQSLYETLSVNDPDNTLSEVFYTIVTLPDFGIIQRTEQIENLGVGDTFTQEEVGYGDIYYYHDGSENHTDSFEFTLSDLASTSETQTYNITVNPVNDAPTLANPIEDQEGQVDDPFSFELAENVFDDVDGDDLTLSATLADDSALPEWLSFDPETATFSGTPDEVTSYTIKVLADDGEATVSDEFILTIGEGNHVPTVANVISDQSTDQYEAFSFTIPANTFSDEDGDDLTLSASLADDSALPSWLSFASTTSTLSGTPVKGDNGEISLKITATDEAENSVSTTFKLTVNFVLGANQETINDISFYPNPADQVLHLALDENMSGQVEFLMFNQSGKMVRQSSLNKIYSSQVFEIDIQNLRKGIYLVKLINENTTATFKINKK